jgi:hypothetical protein
VNDNNKSFTVRPVEFSCRKSKGKQSPMKFVYSAPKPVGDQLLLDVMTGVKK